MRSKRVRWLVDLSHLGSVNAAAKDIGIPQSTLTRVADGRTAAPRLPVLAKLAEFYGVSPEWLTHGQGNGPDIRAINQRRLKAACDAARERYLELLQEEAAGWR